MKYKYTANTKTSTNTGTNENTNNLPARHPSSDALDAIDVPDACVAPIKISWSVPISPDHIFVGTFWVQRLMCLVIFGRMARKYAKKYGSGHEMQKNVCVNTVVAGRWRYKEGL